MDEKVMVKLVVIKKGTPKKAIEEVLNETAKAWEKTCPGEKLLLVPVERS